MKKSLTVLLSLSLILTACGSGEKDSQKQEEAQENDTSDGSSKIKQIVTDKNVSGDNYRTILPFKESAARGLIQEKMANSYNGENFESGLLDISKNVFPTDKFLYQDGQYLDKDTIKAYLRPKFTKKEIEKMDDEEKEQKKATANLGLNPSHKGEDDPKKIAKESPTYLSNILEQDFYKNSDSKGEEIKGMTIGLAMNSTHYYQKEDFGETYSEKLDEKKVEKEGKRMAEEILSRLREHNELNDIPINFAIYMQSGQNSITPGHFVAYATADEDKTKLTKWNQINEQTVLVPSSEAKEKDEGLNNSFKEFNDNLQSYFSNFTQAVGKAKFVGNDAKSLSIDVPIDYYGQAELIGITQYVTQLADKNFSGLNNYEIHIKDDSKSRALIYKSKDDKEPRVHIYNNN
ncbi:CamS family sex pheromone protein [Staphylococcus massiliensis]|uniref:Lipoprotein n=1 Tax=Staphylococcus massiliensis S46 TaxID=1229783 RepID=K9AWD9_9STAP|nr:CamS family sex pheromone protein [Staphylococcus massiliensis]EKU46852.1 hypothetical protein C273_08631 [Staphylococcus massiliensis S46]PNZ98088.1 hypothetical protein CD133_09400 [Staphylococcus massiliensis CCUG 55927]